MLDLSQIQGMVLGGRPMPYVGSYVLFRIDDAKDAHTLLDRLLPDVTSAAEWSGDPKDLDWLNIGFTYQGLERLGVPADILAGFPAEFRLRMRERHVFLGDVGESDPIHWDMPADSENFDVALLTMAPDGERLDANLAVGRAALAGLAGVRVAGRIDVALPNTGREHFGYRDGISRPFIEGQPGEPLPGQGKPVKAGEFILGYTNELGVVATGPGPEEFWRNGTYLSVRKLRQKVGLFRQFLADQADDEPGQELLAAKMVGRWRSGCPLALSPDKDDQELAKDRTRNNDFAYYEDDPHGMKTPAGSHIRRINPRDALQGSATDPRLHRLLRTGATYGPPLAEGAPDDGLDRGLILAFVNASPSRQFEFVQSQWVNDGNFISAGGQKDPIVGVQSGGGDFTYPARPVRKHLQGLPSFVVTRGGEHLFLPSLRGLGWLSAQR